MRLAATSRTLPSGLVIVLLLGGCGSDGGGSATLSDAQAMELSGALSNELGNLTAGLVRFDLSGSGMQGSLPAPGAMPAGILAGLVGRGPSAAHREAYRAAIAQMKCAPSVSDSTDSDADGLPDNALYTWNCSYLDSTGYGYSLKGKARLRDVHDASAGVGYSILIDHLTFTSSGSGGPVGSSPTTTSTEVNGTLLSDASATGAGAYQDMEWLSSENGIRTARVHWKLNLTFLPDAPIDFAGKDLPAGGFTLDGRFSYLGDAAQSPGNWTFAVSTVTPMYFNGTCDLTPAFTQGAIKAALTADDQLGFYLIYTGCGQGESFYTIKDAA